MLAATGLTLPGAWSPTQELVKTFRQGLAEYRKGGLIDATDLWVTSEHARKEILEGVRDLLAGTAPAQTDPVTYDILMPRFQRQGDQAEFAFPAGLLTWDVVQDKPGYQIDTELILTGPLVNRPQPTSNFHVKKIRLLNGLTAPDLRRGPR